MGFRDLSVGTLDTSLCVVVMVPPVGSITGPLSRSQVAEETRTTGETCAGTRKWPERLNLQTLVRLMNKILHDLKDSKLWELWCVPYNG